MPSTKSVLRRYWDAFCFIAILNNESEAGDCARIVEDAKEGRTEIIISPLVQVEVVRPRSAPVPLSPDVAEKVRGFFENDYIKWRTIDRAIGDRAQSLCWRHGLHPRDALHVAVAIDSQCDLLETADPRMLRLNEKHADITLKVQRPKWVGTPDLFEEQKP